MALIIYRTFILEELRYKKSFFSDDINQVRLNNDISKNEVDIVINKNMVENDIILDFMNMPLQFQLLKKFKILLFSNIFRLLY